MNYKYKFIGREIVFSADFFLFNTTQLKHHFYIFGIKFF